MITIYVTSNYQHLLWTRHRPNSGITGCHDQVYKFCTNIFSLLLGVTTDPPNKAMVRPSSPLKIHLQLYSRPTYPWFHTRIQPQIMYLTAGVFRTRNSHKIGPTQFIPVLFKGSLYTKGRAAGSYDLSRNCESTEVLSKQLCHFTFPSRNVRGSQFLHILHQDFQFSTFIIVI